MDINKLFEEFLVEAKKQDLVINYIEARKDGEIVYDWSRLHSKSRLNSWSVSKSIISLFCGIAMDEGYFTLDDYICDEFGEYIDENTPDNLKNLQVKHLLTMTTGLENALFFGDDPIRYVTKDWVSYFFKQSFPYKPGERFLYSNFNTYMLAVYIEKKIGQDLLEYMTPRFFDPLEIYSVDWTRCPMGHIYAANGLYLQIEEMGRIGQMLLDGGVYKGKRIVSKEYLDMALTNQLDSSIDRLYGFFFWIDDGDKKTPRADGKYGQYIYVLKEQNMVISMMSLESKDIKPLLWDKVISKLQ